MNSFDYESQAFIIHRRPYRETSLLVDAFTENYGRMSFVAKGVRTARSRFFGVLEPFYTIRLHVRGKHELKQLIDAESIDTIPSLAPAHWLSGFYVNELLYRLLAREYAMPGLFADYQEVLAQLSSLDNAEPHLRYFELSLLLALGYQLNLDEDAEGQGINASSTYLFKPEVGLVKTHEGMISGETLQALANKTIATKNQRQEAKQLLRYVLGVYLGTKPLQSREIWRRMKATSSEKIS